MWLSRTMIAYPWYRGTVSDSAATVEMYLEKNQNLTWVTWHLQQLCQCECSVQCPLRIHCCSRYMLPLNHIMHCYAGDTLLYIPIIPDDYNSLAKLFSLISQHQIMMYPRIWNSDVLPVLWRPIAKLKQQENRRPHCARDLRLQAYLNLRKLFQNVFFYS